MSIRKSQRFLAKSLGRPQSAHSLSALAAPTFGRNSSSLEKVPECAEVDLNSPVMLERRLIQRSHDFTSLQRAIVGLFQRKEPLVAKGELSSLHDNIRNILNSNSGVFVSDYYKQQLLTKGMIILRENLKGLTGRELLASLEETWNYFFKKILPTLEAILYPAGNTMNIRQTTLLSFRDVLLVNIPIEDSLKSVSHKVSPSIKHMFLIVQSVNDCYPPNKNKLLIESIVARIVIPYLGFRGLYNGGTEPIIPSMEPVLVARRKSADVGPRRISRPLSVQPRQIETLQEMFLNAIRKKQDLKSNLN